MQVRVAAIPRYRVEVRAFHVLLAILLAETAVFTLFGVVNRDEGWYLRTSGLVFEGKLPYRDIPYFQGPVLPYIYGLPQAMFGPSLLAGRLTSAVFVLVTFMVLLRCARMIGGNGAVNWTLGLLCLNPCLLAFSTLARSEAATTLLCSLALLAFFSYRQGTRALWLAPAALLLASGIRITTVPAFIGLTAFIWWQTPATGRQRLSAGALLLAEAAIIAVPVLLSPHRAFFDIWTAQMTRADQWTAAPDSSLAHVLTVRLRDMESIWIWYTVIVVAAIALVTHLSFRLGEGWRPSAPRAGGDDSSNYVFIMAFAVVLLAPYVTASPFEPRYFGPSSALLAVAIGAAAVQLPAAVAVPSFGPYFTRLMIVVAVLSLPLALGFTEPLLRFHHPDLQQSHEVGQVVRSYMGPDDELMTFDTTLALQADVPLMPGMDMAQFSYWARMPSSSATSRGVINRDQLRGAIRDGRPKVVAFTDLDLLVIDFAADRDPSGKTAPAITGYPGTNVLPELVDHYTLMNTIPDYGQFRDKLYIYVRTDAPSVDAPAAASP